LYKAFTHKHSMDTFFFNQNKVLSDIKYIVYQEYSSNTVMRVSLYVGTMFLIVNRLSIEGMH